MAINSYLPEGSIINTEENRKNISDIESLARAKTLGLILEGMATECDSSLSLKVELGNGLFGLIPKDEVVFDEKKEIKDIAVITRVGKAVCFKVKEVFEKSRNGIIAILSRKDAQKECMAHILGSYTPGDVVSSKVTHLEHFGAFVDIGCGIISLLSIDCISVSRIAHPKDRFSVGQYIKTVIKTLDRETGRIYVTHKELLGTWLENASLFSPGMTVAGIVRSVEEYGIFVELTPNLAGLAEFRDDISVGQVAAVYIKNIIPERMKVKLVLIDSYKGEKKTLLKEYTPSDISHIEKWRYSPENCSKLIETTF